MPLGRGVFEVFESIPERIEVSGHGPTWRVTGGSFDSVLAYADEAFGETVVVAREDRSRWWPRVTLTVTQDPELAADAPPVDVFADSVPDEDPAARADQVQGDDDTFRSMLAEIFDHQEQLRLARRGVPPQRIRRS
jgi:hypothetical protein